MRSLAFFALFALGGALSCSSKQGAPSTNSSPSGGTATGPVSGAAGTAGATSSVGGALGGSAGANAGAAGNALAGGGGTASGSGGAAGGSTAGAGTAGGTSGGGAGAAAGPPYGHPDPTVTAPKYDGFTLWVVEDFTQPLDLDHDPIWTYSDGGFQTHRFTKDAITFADGKMVLTLSDTTAPSSCSFANTGVVPEQARTTGELRSKHNWFRYGRYEARLKAPNVKPNDAITNGNYIASFFTYRQPACQQWREIDLEVTGDSANHLSTNLITGDNDCNFSPDKQQVAAYELPGNFRTDFQTIGFEWLPGSIMFYYLGADGKPVQVRQLSSAKVPTLSAKLLANLWVFAPPFDFGGPMGANDELPFRAEYDFIRFYKWDQDLDYPCAGMSAACLKPDDVDLTSNNACDGIPLTGNLAACKQCGTTVRMACQDICQ